MYRLASQRFPGKWKTGQSLPYIFSVIKRLQMWCPHGGHCHWKSYWKLKSEKKPLWWEWWDFYTELKFIWQYLAKILMPRSLKNLDIFLLFSPLLLFTKFLSNFFGIYSMFVSLSICFPHFLFLSGGLRAWQRDRLQMSRKKKKERTEKIPRTDPQQWMFWINGLHSLRPHRALVYLTKALYVPGAILPHCICTPSLFIFRGSALGRWVLSSVTPRSGLIALKGGTWQWMSSNDLDSIYFTSRTFHSEQTLIESNLEIRENKNHAHNDINTYFLEFYALNNLIPGKFNFSLLLNIQLPGRNDWS